MDSFFENMTEFDDADGCQFQNTKSLQFEGSFDIIMNENLEQNTVYTPNESVKPGSQELDDINFIYLSVPNDHVSNLNPSTNTNQNLSVIPITTTDPSASLLRKTERHDIMNDLNISSNVNSQFSRGNTYQNIVRVSHDVHETQSEKREHNEKRNDIDNTFQPNAALLFGENYSNEEYLGEQNEIDATSYLNQMAHLPNCPTNVLVPLSVIKTLMNSHTAMASQEVCELAPNATHNQNSTQSQINDSSTSQILKGSQLSSVPKNFETKSKMDVCDNSRQEDHDGLVSERNTHTGEKKVRRMSKSMMIDKGKDVLNNTRRKVISRDNYRPRNKHNSTNDNSEKNKSSKSAQQDSSTIEACKVCGDIASTHVHYGGRSCQGCRAFFRRSVVKVSKYPGFKYFCKCSERCFDKDQFSCNEYGKHGKNGCRCKYCRFKKCQESAGMADKWVKRAYSQEPEATINDVKNLIQGSTSDKSGCYKKTENTFPSNSHELYDSQPKRLKHRQSVLRNDENQESYKNKPTIENLAVASDKAFGASGSEIDNKLLFPDSGGDGGDVDKLKNEELGHFGQSNDEVATKLSSLLKSFDSIQSLVSTLSQQQILMKTRLDSLSGERKMVL